MTYPVFIPQVDPSPGTEVSHNFALNESSFGDGYTQSSPKGINHMSRTLKLKWEALTHEQCNTLNNFFASLGGYKPFLYKHFSDEVQRQWTCKDFSAVYGAPTTFSATLVEDFSLAS